MRSSRTCEVRGFELTSTAINTKKIISNGRARNYFSGSKSCRYLHRIIRTLGMLVPLLTLKTFFFCFQVLLYPHFILNRDLPTLTGSLCTTSK